MTRRDEIQWEAGSIVNRMIHRGVSEHYDTYYQAFQEGAQWADKTMIEKVCEILKNVTVTYNRRFFGKCEENAFDADFIKEFRKAMEE